MQDKIPTNKGDLSIPEIMDALAYGSYASNRDCGMTHDQLPNLGIGTEEFKIIYESGRK